MHLLYCCVSLYIYIYISLYRLLCVLCLLHMLCLSLLLMYCRSDLFWCDLSCLCMLALRACFHFFDLYCSSHSLAFRWCLAVAKGPSLSRTGAGRVWSLFFEPAFPIVAGLVLVLFGCELDSVSFFPPVSDRTPPLKPCAWELPACIAVAPRLSPSPGLVGGRTSHRIARGHRPVPVEAERHCR